MKGGKEKEKIIKKKKITAFLIKRYLACGYKVGMSVSKRMITNLILVFPPQKSNYRIFLFFSWVVQIRVSHP